MIDDPPPAETVAALLETLRSSTGRPGLELAEAPQRLSGGFYAELLRFRLTGAPEHLTGDLVARIVPNPAAGAWEAAIQGSVADQGFPTPAVRLTADETGPLGRYLIVMDALDGRPPMAGLTFRTIGATLPDLVRGLPDQLAHIAADLHDLDAEPLVERLAALGSAIPATTAGFVEAQADLAASFGRPDVAGAAHRLVASEPRATARVVAHGDLHPFNLLVTADGTALIDWTVARVAHPAFTVAFTTLVLGNPPIALPRPGAAALRPVGRSMARRFLATYRARTEGTPAAVDDESLAWHRKVHALRVLVELAGWDAGGTRPTAGHPWLVLEPVARRALGLDVS